MEIYWIYLRWADMLMLELEEVLIEALLDPLVAYYALVLVVVSRRGDYGEVGL